MLKTGAEIIWECLERLGVKVVFGYPGGAILPTYDAMTRYRVHHVLVRHEQGATHMADGYARASGGVGVAMATSGPGATNMVTGIATAMMDSSPIVCITGQVGSKLIGTDAFQETDITGITLPITKHNYLVTRAEEIAPSLREAFQIAASDRPGPVLVDITKDAQKATCEFDWDAAAPKVTPDGAGPFPQARRTRRSARADQRSAAAGNSRRPRHHSFRREQEVMTFAEKASIPVAAHAARPRRLPSLASSISGHDGHARRSLGQRAIQESDLLHRPGHALRRSRDWQAENLRAHGEKDSHRDRSARRSIRTSAWTSR